MRNQYIDQKIRESLNITDDRTLTPDDLRAITGIQISNSDTNITACDWHGSASMYQMALPNLFLNFNGLSTSKDWEDDLHRLTHIKSLYCNAQVPSSFISSIKDFSNLTDLTLTRQKITDWSFLSNLSFLRMVTLYQCGDSGNEAIKRLCGLHATYHLLSHIAVAHMNVSDLTPFSRVDNLDELNLSHNNIHNVSPLSDTRAYCLTLRHNKIEDIAPLNLSGYMLNLRHNRIKTIKPIIDWIDERGETHELFGTHLARLFINYNPIPESELQTLGRHHFVAQDFIRDDFTRT